MSAAAAQAAGTQTRHDILRSLAPNIAPPANATSWPRFAVPVMGDTMQPRFEPGMLIVIDPEAQLTAGRSLVIVLRPRRPGKEPRYLLKHLLEDRPDGLLVEQYNPRRQFLVRRERILIALRVVGWYLPADCVA